jgi:hypothetical protein
MNIYEEGKMKVLSLTIFSLIVCSARIFSSARDVGCTFLIITPGARQVAMGSAFTAISDDAHAIYYNDGGLGFQKSPNGTFMYADWLPDLCPGMKHLYGGIVYPLGKLTMGCQIIYLNTGKTGGDVVDEMGRVITTEEWETVDYSVKVSCGTKITESLSVGGGIKYIYSFLLPDTIAQLVDTTAKGSGYSIAFDIGFLHKTSFKGLTYGISIKNMGPGIKIGSSKDPLPYLIRLGTACKVVEMQNASLLLAVDLTKVLVKIDEDFEKGGISYIIDDTFKSLGIELETKFIEGMPMYGRLGYFHDKTGKRIGYTIGVGIKWKGLNFDIATDENIYDLIDENTRFSLSYSFDRKKTTPPDTDTNTK